MKSEWEKCEFQKLYCMPSRNGLSKPSKIRGNGYKMINMGELFANDRIYDIPMELVPVNDKEKESSQVFPCDLLFARQSLVASGAGKCSIVVETSPLTVFESHLIRVRLNPAVADPFFYYYYFKSDRSPIKTIVQHSVQAGIKASDLAKLAVDCPPLATQKRIAQVLCTFDDKIELNNRINENMVNQIQAIYNNEYDPATYSPNGVLSDICAYSKVKIAVSELSLSSYYSTENMLPNKVGAVDAANLPSVSQTTKCHKGDVLISNIRPYFKKIVYVTEECGCSTDVLCFTPKGDYSQFLFSALYADRFFDYMVAGAKGTKMPRGDKQQIMNYPLVIPPMKSLAKFNGVVTPMLEKIEFNRKENKRLETIRDTLLPKLMSGELDLSEVGI